MGKKKMKKKGKRKIENENGKEKKKSFRGRERDDLTEVVLVGIRWRRGVRSGGAALGTDVGTVPCISVRFHFIKCQNF